MRRRPTLRQTLRAAALLAWLGVNALAAWHLPEWPRLTLPITATEEKVHGVSPDGCWLATSGARGYADPIHLWNVWTGEARTVHHADPNAPGLPGQLAALRFSADGQRLVWNDSANAVHLFDLASEREVAVLHWPDDAAPADPARVRLSVPDPNTVVGIHEELVLWDAPTGWVRLRVPHGTHALSPNGNLLATSTAGGVRLWDVATGRELRTLPADQLDFEALTFSPDGRFLLANGPGRWTPWVPGKAPEGFNLSVWDVADGRLLWQRPGTPSAAWATSDRIAAVVPSSGADSRFVFWDAATGEERHAERVPRLSSVRATEHRLILVCGNLPPTIPAWRYQLARWLPTMFQGWLLPGGKAEVWLIDPATGSRAAWSRGTEYIFSPDGRTMVEAWGFARIGIWDVPPRKPWGWFAAAVGGQAALAAWVVRWRAKASGVA